MDTKQERRYDVDWLRIIAMLAVFIYHSTRLFDPEGWHLKNPQQSMALFITMRGLIWFWVMELFFLLSGMGTFYALKKRKAGAYLWERVKRLLIPLYTVGLLVLLPIQFFFELYTNAAYRGDFWQVIPKYFDRFGFPRLTQWPSTLLPMPFAGHLWFLQYLFLISLLSLPLLLYLKTEKGKRWIAKFAGWSEKTGGIFVFVIPLFIFLTVLRVVFKNRFSWADLAWYGIFFIIGYMMAADNRFTAGIKKHGWFSLGLWIVGFGGIGFLNMAFGFDPTPGKEPFSSTFVIFHILWSVASFSAVVFVLSLGAKYLNKSHRALNYANEAVLPFYLFHQTIILCIGWYVIEWNIGIAFKLPITILLAFPLIVMLYELLVRRFNIIRFLFGMRPKQGR